MKSLNFLFAIKDISGDVRFVQSLKERLVTGIDAQGYCQVGHFDFAFTKDSLVEKMKSNVYDVVLCNEELGADKIGIGSLRSWKEEFPNIRVILLVGNARKGNIKLIQLIQKLEYTDVLYMGDMNGKSICDLLENPRSVKDAVYYYGIENSEDIISMGILEGEEAPQKEVVEETKEELVEEVKEEPVSVEEVPVTEIPVTVEEVAEASIDDITQSLEDAIKSFEDFPEFEEEPKKGEVVEEPATPGVEESQSMGFNFDQEFTVEEIIEEKPVVEEPVEEKEESDFDFFNKTEVEQEEVITYKDITDKEEVVGENIAEPEPELIRVENVEFDEEEITSSSREVVVGETVVVEETKEEPKDIFTMPIMENVSRGGAIVRTQSEQILSTMGYITKVVDEDSLLVELDNNIPLNEDLQAYRLLIRIKSGRKGMMENGRYRSANISLEAYVECMVGCRTVIVEVMDFDCMTNATLLENKECTIILTKM